MIKMSSKLWFPICSVILLTIAMVVCLALELYVGALFIFGATLVIVFLFAYTHRVSPPTAVVNPDTTFVHPSQITIVSVPTESKGETKEVKVEEINIETKH